MKRKKIFLQHTIYQLFFGIMFLTMLYGLEQVNMERTIGKVYYEDIEEAMDDIILSLSRNPIIFESEVDIQGEIPRDMAVLLLEGDEITNLNPEDKAISMAAFLRNHFLPSIQGERMISSGQNVKRRVVYRDERKFPRSFYVAIHFLDTNGNAPVLVLAKDLSIWDAFLLNSKNILFIMIMFFIGLMVIQHRILVRKLRNPIIDMTEVAFRYSQNNFSRRAAVEANDEIGNLATSINKLGKAMEASNIMNTQEREMLVHVLESLPVGIVYVDRDYNITIYNSAGRDIYNQYASSEDKDTLYGINEDYQIIIDDIMQSGLEKRMEVQIMQKFLDIRFYPLFWESQSHVKGVLLSIEDITNAKRNAIIQEELVTNISHDLRTPLSTIKGYSEAIIDNIAESEAEKVELARIIFEEASEMNATINSILELARMQAGYQQLELNPVSLRDFFEHMLARFANVLHQERIHTHITIEDGVKYYEMDEKKMSQALYNLIDNAIRYAADPQMRTERFIHIRARLDEVKDEVLIELADNGIGISEDSLPYIFERFYKDDKARTKRKNQGTGIGLSLVQYIIAAHGGKIEVESDVGKGSTFILHLPYRDLPADN